MCYWQAGFRVWKAFHNASQNNPIDQQRLDYIHALLQVKQDNTRKGFHSKILILLVPSQ